MPACFIRKYLQSEFSLLRQNSSYACHSQASHSQVRRSTLKQCPSNGIQLSGHDRGAVVELGIIVVVNPSRSVSQMYFCVAEQFKNDQIPTGTVVLIAAHASAMPSVV